MAQGGRDPDATRPATGSMATSSEAAAALWPKSCAADMELSLPLCMTCSYALQRCMECRSWAGCRATCKQCFQMRLQHV